MPDKPEILNEATNYNGPTAPETSPTATPSPEQTYQSNPFPLVFNALGRIFDKNLWWAIAIAVFGLLGSFQYTYSSPSSGQSTSDFNLEHLPTLDSELLLIIGAVLVVFTLIAFIVGIIQVFINGMFVYVALETEKGRAVSFKEAFRATKDRFWRLFLANGLAGIKIFLWSLLFIIPGIIASLRYALLSYVIMSEPSTNKGVIASHDRVKQVTKGRLIEVLGVGFASGIIPIIGEVLRISGGAAQYRQLELFHDKHLTKPSVHWLNYLGVVLIGLVILLVIVLVGLLIYLFESNFSF